MKALPTPEAGGNLDLLKMFLNLRDESQWHLLVVWLLSAIFPTGPYMILILNGEAGSAKSTLTYLLRCLIDPNVAPLRSLPKTERDLFIAARNAWLTAIDNISFLSNEMADSFCRLSTKGAFATRKLQTDATEVFFNVCRPSLFNGIQDLCFRSDFTDRSIQLSLTRIPDSQRRRSQEITKEFELVLPKIYGALLDALSATIRELPNVQTSSLPRMADFGFFALAAERALQWPEGTVQAAFDRMRKSTNETILESCPYINLIEDLAEKGWQGSAAKLMDQIENRYSDNDWSRKGFPRGLPQLSGQLITLAPAFRSRNVEISTGKTSGTGSERFISIQKLSGGVQ